MARLQARPRRNRRCSWHALLRALQPENAGQPAAAGRRRTPSPVPPSLQLRAMRPPGHMQRKRVMESTASRGQRSAAKRSGAQRNASRDQLLQSTRVDEWQPVESLFLPPSFCT